MNKWYRDNQGTVWIVTIVVSCLAYAFTTFASIDYVDKKHEGVMEVLKEIREDVREIRRHRNGTN